MNLTARFMNRMAAAQDAAEDVKNLFGYAFNWS
jgi:hypothetical protein